MAAKNKQKNSYEEKILGIDYGEVNIGLAFGINNLVSPLKVISGRNANTAISEISRYILENKRVLVFKEELNTQPKFYYFFGV